MHFPTLLAVAVAIGTAAGIPAPSPYILHESRESSPGHWEKRLKAPHDARLSVRIGLAQRNLYLGPHHLEEISDPTSPSYGKHWTAEQIIEFFAPSDDSINSVRTWLEEAGIGEDRQSLTSKRGWIWFDASIGEMEALLNTEYHLFQHSETRAHYMGCDEYSIPVSLRPHIDFITPTIGFQVEDKSTRRLLTRDLPFNQIILGSITSQDLEVDTSSDLSVSLASCANAMTPDCIRALYKIPPNNSTDVQAGNDLGVVEYRESYDQEDLDAFFSNYAKYIPNGTHPTLNLMAGAVGPSYPGSRNTETMLDLDVVYPLVYPAGVTLFQTNADENSILDALDNIYCDKKFQCGLYQPTNVISVSWESGEIRTALETRICNEYMKLGMQGVSVIVSSGDGGVAKKNGSCNVDGSFFVAFPSSCPYVTSVGATRIAPRKTINDPEVAVSKESSGFLSGGGFSRSFERPSFQQNAVSNFLINNPPAYNSTQYNATGRAYPDVSANGDHIRVYVNNTAKLEGGTSASTPLFASIITLINEKRLAANKTVVGFLNPALYANPDAFNDITQGSNPGCGTEGFPAVQGWDPVTGLGTPIYEKLLEVFMALP